MATCDIGVVGLAVMGRNLALNIERNGFDVAVFNRTASVTKEYAEGVAAGKRLHPTYEIEELVAALKRPRRLMLMVQAGRPVDAVIAQLKPLLEPGDIILDGGNSLFSDTDRRVMELAQDGIHYMGVGVSGGEEGALYGPSMMPGGPLVAYPSVAPIFEAVAAKAADGTPCVAYLGGGGAGHYVKMVHNGIEYAIMQAIAEAYDLLSRVGGLSAGEIGAIFEEWNQQELASFLVEITAKILRRTDEGNKEALVNVIQDKAKQKGTGKWTSQNALDLGVPVSAITAAVEARVLSAFKEERVRAATLLRGPVPTQGDAERLVPATRAALFATMIVAYAQGFTLMREASVEYQYRLDLSEVARIWRAGCIIRSEFLEEIRRAFAEQPSLPNLLVDDEIREALTERQQALRAVIGEGVTQGIPMPVLSAALAYYDGYRSARLPANLIQAQRDYFGAHTYERLDREGVFHTEWLEALEDKE